MSGVRKAAAKAAEQNPPIYLATLAALIGRDPSFLCETQLADPTDGSRVVKVGGQRC